MKRVFADSVEDDDDCSALYLSPVFIVCSCDDSADCVQTCNIDGICTDCSQNIDCPLGETCINEVCRPLSPLNGPW